MNSNSFSCKIAACLCGLLAISAVASAKKRDEDPTETKDKKKSTEVQPTQPSTRQRQIESPPKTKVRIDPDASTSSPRGRTRNLTNETDLNTRRINPETLKKGNKDLSTKELSTTGRPKKLLNESNGSTGLKTDPDRVTGTNKNLLKDPTTGRHRTTELDSGTGEKTLPKTKNLTDGENSTGRHKTTELDATAKGKHQVTEGLKKDPDKLVEPQIEKHRDGSVTTSHFSDKGKLSEKIVKQKDGGERIHRFNNKGNLSEQIEADKDGTKHKTRFNDKGLKTREEVEHKDGSREITTHQLTRNGKTHSTQIIKHNAKGLEVSKTVTVKRPVVLSHRSAFEGKPFVKNYNRSRYGFSYHHGHAEHIPLLTFRHDPYWYHDDGRIYHHPFHYDWRWDRHDWYRHRSYYYPVYQVYPSPIYWITDWMMASYIAQSYDNNDYGTDEPDREVVVIKERATPISAELKEEIRAQVEKTLAEEQNQADDESDKPVTSDLTKALTDPKHIYPVSGTLSVTMAADENQSVMVSDGDLLKLEPGQNDLLADATENTFVTMRVMTSKGEEGEARAGDLISVPLKSLQDFESEFRAKIDQGTAEAVENKDLFKSGAKAPSP
jgi:hypothetical protein